MCECKVWEIIKELNHRWEIVADSNFGQAPGRAYEPLPGSGRACLLITAEFHRLLDSARILCQIVRETSCTAMARSLRYHVWTRNTSVFPFRSSPFTLNKPPNHLGHIHDHGHVRGHGYGHGKIDCWGSPGQHKLYMTFSLSYSLNGIDFTWFTQYQKAH
jgi:hypothetical protein